MKNKFLISILLITLTSVSACVSQDKTDAIAGGAVSVTAAPIATISVPQPVLALSPNPQNFGTVSTSSFASQTITVSNSSAISATIGVGTASGVGFTVTASTCNGIVLGAFSSCTIAIRYTPVGVGTVSGTLAVPYTSPQGVAYSVGEALSGTGIPPSVAFAFSGFTGVVGTDTTVISPTGATLQWTAQALASYYKITQTGGGGGTIVTPKIIPTSTSTYNVSALAPGTSYSFKINAYDAADTSDGNANWVTFTTPALTGTTFNGWSDVVATGSIYTDIGAVDNAVGNAGVNRMERNLAAVYGFDNTAVNTVTNQITVGVSILTGTAVKFNSDGTAPAGLVNGTLYYVIKISNTVIQLASTYANALASTPISITTIGTGNMTLMPGGVVKLGWENFTFTPGGSAASYNIYRGVTPAFASVNTLIGTSVTNSFIDNQVTDGTTYYYKVQPVSGVENPAPASTDSIIKIFVPTQNMALIHRWIANREVCTNLMGFAWPGGVDRTNNYACAYNWGTGYAPSTTYSKTQWDIGYSLVVDRWQSGCKMKSYGSGVPAGGAVNDVYLKQGNGTTAGSNGMQCYIKDSVAGWVSESYGSMPLLDRNLMRTNYPGYSSTPINQNNAYVSCQQRSVPGLVDGNGNSALRLLRLHDMTIARAVQGVNVNRRMPATLTTIFSSTNIPVNGSCNSGLNNIYNSSFLDGVFLPNPSTYSLGFSELMNGTYLTRNCYSRYEISSLWDNVYEWTSSQYVASAAGNGTFVASSLDSGDNLLEGFKTDGVMGQVNQYSTYTNNLMFGGSNAVSSILPLFGVQTVSASAPLGTVILNYGNFDFGSNMSGSYAGFSAASATNGVGTGGPFNNDSSTSRYRYNFLSGNSGLENFSGSNAISFRCMGQAP